jgi:hypothetical protein
MGIVPGTRPDVSAAKLCEPGRVTALGIDPGDVTGMLLASWAPGQRRADFARAFQCDRESAPDLLRWILRDHGYTISCGQVEEFRSGSRSVRLRGTNATAIRDEVAELTGIAADFGPACGVVLTARPAVTVKKWASDARLQAAGLLDVTAGQTHARDAARHCIYCATHDRGRSDPLSRFRSPARVPASAGEAADAPAES